MEDNQPAQAAQTAGTQSDQSKPGSKKKLLLGLLLVIILAAVAVWVAREVYKSDDNTETPATAYLSNSNDVVCADIYDGRLRCENIQTNELREFTLPENLNASQLITQSPDGTKFLIGLNDGSTVVTDKDFKIIREIIAPVRQEVSYPKFAWGSGNKLFISEIKREETDDELLPAPLVVRMLDIGTGEEKRVYKTGEKYDMEVGDMYVLGGNDEYVFISLPAAKNWVADSTDQPPATINAIRLSDGEVRQVGMHQIDEAGDGQMHMRMYSGYYDAARGLFVFVATKSGSSDQSLVISKLVDDTYGLQLQKVNVAAEWTSPLGQPPVFTSRGVAVYNVTLEMNGPITLLNDAGGKTELQLTQEESSTLYSLPAMPQLSEAAN